ncbi:MAG TPA: inositol monophosphatase family protein, partial [Rhizomicrobium sp.]|nr:inositol monophosphatase family protein [Rhizomicrobium sp.]
TGIPWQTRGDHGRFLAELGAAMRETAGVRRFGTASLDLAYVASGRFDGYWERDLAPWDVAAGILLVREAGGVVSDLEGGTRALDCGHILAANEPLHPQILKFLKDAARS